MVLVSESRHVRLILDGKPLRQLQSSMAMARIRTRSRRGRASCSKARRAFSRVALKEKAMKNGAQTDRSCQFSCLGPIDLLRIDAEQTFGLVWVRIIPNGLQFN